MKFDHQMAAVDQFLGWVDRTYGGSSRVDIEKAKSRNLPYGLFPAYVRSHEKLRKACGPEQAIKRGSLQYHAAFHRYKTAIALFLQRHSAVAEKVPKSIENGPESAVAKLRPFAVTPFAKFRNKKTRTGTQYFSKVHRFKRDHERRRCGGGGRAKACAIIGEVQARRAGKPVQGSHTTAGKSRSASSNDPAQGKPVQGKDVTKRSWRRITEDILKHEHPWGVDPEKNRHLGTSAARYFNICIN